MQQPSEEENSPLSVSENDLNLSEHKPLAPRSSQKTATVTKHSTVEEKVRFYRSLFRGWDDVYAVRGMDKQGRTVYYRKRELLGKRMASMLTEETCWFLAIDFDKATWKEDTAAFLGLDSYDRMFPNQDTLPRDKKLGNLIALPLQRAAGKQGNSLFIVSDFTPYPDQWVYLSSLPKMSKQEVDAVIGEAQRTGAIIRNIWPCQEDVWRK